MILRVEPKPENVERKVSQPFKYGEKISTSRHIHMSISKSVMEWKQFIHTSADLMSNLQLCSFGLDGRWFLLTTTQGHVFNVSASKLFLFEHSHPTCVFFKESEKSRVVPQPFFYALFKVGFPENSENDTLGFPMCSSFPPSQSMCE